MVTDFRIGHRLPHSGHRLSNWSQTFGFGDRTPSDVVTDFANWSQNTRVLVTDFALY